MNCNSLRSVVLLLMFVSSIASAETSKTLPNILLITLDDAGYGDIAGFGNSTAPTPNLQQFAEQGVKFTRFYADSTCRPARLSLLTGKQASKVVMAPDFHGISPEVETLPEKLKQAGYATYHFGKWHLGDTTRLSWPSAQGFDHWFGFLHQFVLQGPNKEGKAVSRRPTYLNPWLQTDDGEPKQYTGHLEDILADKVVEKIHALKPLSSKQESNKHAKAPWFINYWTLAPHNPATASDVYLKMFPNTAAGKYQALLKQMDDEIGRVLKALDETDQADNTIVVVLSDNGGTNEHEANNGPYQGEKGQYSEGGTRTPMIIRWPHHVAAKQSYDGIAAIYDLYPTLLATANVRVADSDGVNLFPLIEQNKMRPPQTLFWETGDDYNYAYSVLDEKGRWRLDDKRLFDLQKDPYAKKNIASKNPDKVKELKQLFLAWRKQVHRVDLKQETLLVKNSPDTYTSPVFKMTGDSFRRSPGYGGFTFVSSITPLPDQALKGVIAEQKGMWSLSVVKDAVSDKQRLLLHMNDQEFLTEPVKIEGCTPLVLSTYYFRSKLQPHSDHGVWYLMLGTKEVLLEKRPKPSIFPDNFLEATFIGRDAEGLNPLSGKIESPQFYNEFFYSHDSWKVDRDPYWLSEMMCQKKAS